jgi:cytidylate kinase
MYGKYMKKENNKTIIIFGLSGSGKSTLANMIAEEYKIRVVHPSGILRNLLENKEVDVRNSEYNKGFWESEKGVQVFRDRLKEKFPMDMVSDKILLTELEKGNLVMDSWSMPWLFKKGVKIYLKCSLSERSRRVSLRSKISPEESRRIVSMKDNETQKMFKRIYGFDIKKDFDVFDFILDVKFLDEKQVFEEVMKFLNVYYKQ